MKKFWDQNYGGQPYDAVARRKGVALDTPATIAPLPRQAAHSVATNRAATRTPSGGTLAPRKLPVGHHHDLVSYALLLSWTPDGVAASLVP